MSFGGAVAHNRRAKQRLVPVASVGRHVGPQRAHNSSFNAIQWAPGVLVKVRKALPKRPSAQEGANPSRRTRAMPPLRQRCGLHRVSTLRQRRRAMADVSQSILAQKVDRFLHGPPTPRELRCAGVHYHAAHSLRTSRVHTSMSTANTAAGELMLERRPFGGRRLALLTLLSRSRQQQQLVCPLVPSELHPTTKASRCSGTQELKQRMRC